MEKDSTMNIHKAEALYALLTDEDKEKVNRLIADLIKTQYNP